MPPNGRKGIPKHPQKLNPKRPARTPGQVAEEARPKAASRSALAFAIYDTSNPPISAYQAALIAKITPTTFYTMLKIRERHRAETCPTCGRYPGQPVRPRRPWTARVSKRFQP